MDAKDKVARSAENWSQIFPGLDVENLYVFSRMRLIIKGLRIGRDEILKKHDVTEGEFDLMCILVRNQRPMSPSELAIEAKLTRGGISKRLKLLEQRSFISKIEDESDGRAYQVAAKPYVKSILRPILEEISALEIEVLHMLPQQEQAALNATLQFLATQIEQNYPTVPSTAPN